MNRCSRRQTVEHWPTVAATLAVLSLAGCYEHTTNGNESVYRFAWWLGPAVIVGGLLAAPIGWLVRRASRRWGVALMVLGPLALILVAPAMFSDHVVIDDEHFEARYGFWFSPTVHNVRFADLREIRYVAVRGSKGRTNYELHCVPKSGQMFVVHAGDLVRETVLEIGARARAKGVSFIDEAD